MLPLIQLTIATKAIVDTATAQQFRHRQARI